MLEVANPLAVEALLAAAAAGACPRADGLRSSPAVVDVLALLEADLDISHNRLRKCTYLLNKTKNLVEKEWGLNPARAMWIYEAIICPKLTYGCLVWSQSLDQTNINLLNRVQRLGLMGASHFLWSTPLAVLEAILGILQIRLHISALAEAARFRTRPLLWDRWDGVGDRR